MCESIRQAREELIRQERISTIGRLSSSIVHDLRNPLAAVYGGAEMLVDADLNPRQVKRLAGNIYRASRRIQELLQDLLNVSRGSARGAEVCKLREVAAAGCESLLASAEAQGVEVQIRIPDEIELPLERNRMERVFSNLVGNALEMMPEGGRIRISAAAQKRIRSGGRARCGSGDRAGDSWQPVRAVRQRGEEERTGAGAGAFAADGAGPRGRHVGGIGTGRGRVLPGAAAGGGVRRGARMQIGRAKPILGDRLGIATRPVPRGSRCGRWKYPATCRYGRHSGSASSRIRGTDTIRPSSRAWRPTAVRRDRCG